MLIENKGALTEGRFVRIARLDAEGYDFVDDPQSALKEIRKAGERADLFTFVQRVSEPQPRYSFRWQHDNFAVLPVSTYEHWMKEQIDFKARNKTRKAGKAGVVLREVALDDALVHGISEIYNESPVRQGKPFRHYQKSLDAVRRMNATFLERSIFLGAYLGETLIGFVKLVVSEDGTQAGLMQIVSMVGQRDKAPTNALIAQAVQSCADRGIPYLWYANFSYGNKEQDGLQEFKHNNGFRKVDIPRYYIPLTALGHMALRLGIHQRSIHWIPEPVAARYRKLRSRWYQKKMPTSKAVPQIPASESLAK